MDTVVFKLSFCLALVFAELTTVSGNWSPRSTVTVPVTSDNSTKREPLNTSEQSTTLTTGIPDTTPTSAADNSTFTAVTNSSHAQTMKSTTVMEPINSTSEATATTATQTEVPSTSESHTYHSTTTTATTAKAVITNTTANSSVVTSTSQSELSTRGPQLSISERNLTITFSVMLGLSALAVVAVKFHRWSHKLQFLHQPLHNTQDLNALTEEPGTLVISEGLYNEHPIYDNVPPARQDEAHFSLEFLH
ncbi:hypothetical protein NL108_010312 [Boleophthalmus pectinirostris]|nr:hypothetical protein NL108_010312 [Boleophthalmus pectinirostris]